MITLMTYRRMSQKIMAKIRMLRVSSIIRWPKKLMKIAMAQIKSKNRQTSNLLLSQPPKQNESRTLTPTPRKNCMSAEIRSSSVKEVTLIPSLGCHREQGQLQKSREMLKSRKLSDSLSRWLRTRQMTTIVMMARLGNAGRERRRKGSRDRKAGKSSYMQWIIIMNRDE